MTRPFKPDPNAIYLTDNGRALCGAHLGASARMTGHDISGQRIHRVTHTDVLELASTALISSNDPNLKTTIKCEDCGKVAQ